ncbi:MAG: hypothetical protein K1060chlam1_00535 [Candidatus Anoxychlamydiales bacterium]|nr:hypothetical protein [Candidatus Anoxychlamydiales bacterium]
MTEVEEFIGSFTDTDPAKKTSLLILCQLLIKDIPNPDSIEDSENKRFVMIATNSYFEKIMGYIARVEKLPDPTIDSSNSANKPIGILFTKINLFLKVGKKDGAQTFLSEALSYCRKDKKYYPLVLFFTMQIEDEKDALMILQEIEKDYSENSYDVIPNVKYSINFLFVVAYSRFDEIGQLEKFVKELPEKKPSLEDLQRDGFLKETELEMMSDIENLCGFGNFDSIPNKSVFLFLVGMKYLKNQQFEDAFRIYFELAAFDEENLVDVFIDVLFRDIFHDALNNKNFDLCQQMIDKLPDENSLKPLYRQSLRNEKELSEENLKEEEEALHSMPHSSSSSSSRAESPSSIVSSIGTACSNPLIMAVAAAFVGVALFFAQQGISRENNI